MLKGLDKTVHFPEKSDVDDAENDGNQEKYELQPHDHERVFGVHHDELEFEGLEPGRALVGFEIDFEFELRVVDLGVDQEHVLGTEKVSLVAGDLDG